MGKTGNGVLVGFLLAFLIIVLGSIMAKKHDQNPNSPRPHSSSSDHPMQDDLPTSKPRK